MKKDKQLIREETDKLYQEIIDNGYSIDIAKQICDDMREKGGYLFNKSHAQSYAILCFQTAFLKYHHPIQFFKALFNLNKDTIGMINKYIIDAKDFGVTVLPPNINLSEINFSIYNNKIIFGLSAIKGIGESAANNYIDNRNENGKYHSLQELIDRVNPKKTEIISLIKSGAIPTHNKRTTLQKYLMSCYDKRTFKPVSAVPSPYSKLEQLGLNVDNYRVGKKVNKEKLLIDVNKRKEQLFNESEQERISKYQRECEDKYLKNEEFWEFETLQIFLGNNPFDVAYNYLTPFKDVENGTYCTIVGIISKVQKKKDKNKKQFAYVNIYSSFGLVEGIVWHSTLSQYEDLICNGSKVAMYVKKDNDEKIVVDKIKPYSLWLKQKNMKVVK